MIYKVKTYLHNSINTQIDDDFVKCQEYFKAHGIDLILDFEKTDIPKYDVPLKLFSINEGACDVVMYVYNRETFQQETAGIAFNVSPTLRATYISTSSLDDTVDYHWKFFSHELVHTLFYKFGIAHLDPMDKMIVAGVVQPYYKNEEIEANGWSASGGNFDTAWKILAPYLADKKTVVLKRGYADKNQQLGDLSVGTFACKTLEKPWLNNQKNISCIPKGIYDVKWTFSPRFLKYTYEILNVPNRSGIRIHPGNFFFNIDGCVLLGDKYGDLNHDSSADILNSAVTLKKFEDYMERKSFRLQII